MPDENRPEHNAEDHNRADNHPHGVTPRVARLRVANRVANRRRSVRHSVYGSVDHSGVYNLPKHIRREPHERTHHCGRIQFIHVIFVVEQLVHAFRGPALYLLRIHPPRHNQTQRCRNHRHDRKNMLQRLRRFSAACFASAKHRRKKLREVILAAKQRRQREPPACQRKKRKNHQWAGHASRRFMHVHVMFVVARLAVKRQPDQPKHVKRSEHCREQSHAVQHLAAIFIVVCGKQDRILREKRRKRRESRNGNRAKEHAPVGGLDFLAEAAHVPHVLLAAHRVNHAASRKEQQRLEEGMCHQVENPRAERAYAAGQEHADAVHAQVVIDRRGRNPRLVLGQRIAWRSDSPHAQQNQ